LLFARHVNDGEARTELDRIAYREADYKLLRSGRIFCMKAGLRDVRLALLASKAIAALTGLLESAAVSSRFSPETRLDRGLGNRPAEPHCHNGSDVSYSQASLMLGQHGDDRIPDHTGPPSLESRRRSFGRRFS
jgi:hypothetical protein